MTLTVIVHEELAGNWPSENDTVPPEEGADSVPAKQVCAAEASAIVIAPGEVGKTLVNAISVTGVPPVLVIV